MRIYYRRYLSFARIRGEEEKKNGARWKIKAEEAYIWTIHLRQFLFFLFFIRAHEGAKCKVSKEKGPGVTMSIVPPTGIFFRQRWNNRWEKEGEARKRVDLRKDERAEDGGDEKCGGYTLASYLEYELWLLNFIVVRGMNRVSRHTFTSNSLQVGGRKKLNKSLLRRVSFSQSSFFSENILPKD